MRCTLVSMALKGGIVHYSVLLANALSERASVRVVVPEGAQTDGYHSEVEVHSVPVPMEASCREAIRVPLRLLQLPRFLRALHGAEGEVVHFLNRHEYLTFAAPLVRDRLVVTLHDPRPHLGEASPRKRLANWTLRRYASGLIVHGGLLKQHLIEQGVPASKVAVVPHGTFGPFTRSSPIPDHNFPTGLFFGRIVPYKGLETLLQAVPIIRERLPSFRLVIAGEGDVRPYERLLNAAPLRGGVELVNRFVPDSEMADLFANCSLVILPYLEATQSGVIPLAYGAARPVVATAVGAIPDVVRDGGTGLLVEPDRPQALAEAVIRVASDISYAQRLGSAGLQYSETQLAWPAIAEKTLAFYRQLGFER